MLDFVAYQHNKAAPYWAIALVVFGISGISTNWISWGDAWQGYILDITGPAWNYILFRGLFTTYKINRWTRFFSPARTFIIFVLVCFSIETAQYFNLYSATYDPLDLLAYISLLLPVFLTDLLRLEQAKQKKGRKSGLN